MKSIGDQAKSFREWMRWDAQRMADEVARHFKRGKMSRQKIEQLEDAGDRLPQYIVALARTMDTTVEDLYEGRWSRPDEEPPSQREETAHAFISLESCLRTLAAASVRLKDQAKREDAADLIRLVIQRPEENADDQIPVIVKKLSGESGEEANQDKMANAA